MEHPEWVPVDRSGRLKQGGPIEFAYPEARKALVDLHMKFVRQDGYDGVIFLTYAENYSMRFQDEFGFNEPIVREFKRRTGVDLRTQPFTRTGSRYDWYALRGEYLTQYLRELKEELRRDGKKLGIFVNPQQPHFTQPWNVPELMLTGGPHLRRPGDATCGTGSWTSWWSTATATRAPEPDPRRLPVDDPDDAVQGRSPHLEPDHRGVAAISECARRRDDHGRARRRHVARPLPCARTRRLGAARLGSAAKMRLLAQVSLGKAKAPMADVMPLAEHANPIVRRLALLSLGKLKERDGLAVIYRGLDDAENAGAVRLHGDSRSCRAGQRQTPAGRAGEASNASAGGNRGGHAHTLQPPARDELVEAVENSPEPVVRAISLRAFAQFVTEPMVDTLAAALNDRDRYVRFAAAFALGHYVRSVRATDVLIAATKHEDPVVSNRAATSLAMIAARGIKEIEPKRTAVLTALKGVYASLGDGCRRADADWGYRPVGNALLKLGPEGEQVLRVHESDQRPASGRSGVARACYIKHDNGRFFEVTEPENDSGHEGPSGLARHTVNASQVDSVRPGRR